MDIELAGLSANYASQAILGMARIGACFAWLPYLSAGAIPSKVPRSVLALVTLIGFWPVTATAIVPQDMPGMLLAVGMEALVGTAIGLMVSLPFHTFHALGAIVDNQRGASISSTLDPISGIEATETANLLQMFSVVIFLTSGGLLSLLEVIQASYSLLPMGGRFVPNLHSMHIFMATLLAGAVRMALPVLLLLFVVEVFLGVLSRFAQQMNAFSVSLALKSFLAFLALLVYLSPTMVDQVPSLWMTHGGLDMIDSHSGQSP
ncbi:type III secretion system export apparatus subunit SctT [Dyella sp. Tek66A03]|uniref:type III secretion system export apparatus subunit SctT n=1 Tax=Dyella sp. Tek66A03 TaxID=3458298 RepID=UPI00403EE508